MLLDMSKENVSKIGLFYPFSLLFIVVIISIIWVVLLKFILKFDRCYNIKTEE
jgi:hypothetical protein